MEEQIYEIIEMFEELLEEPSLPKNIKESINKIIRNLKEEHKDISLKINAALAELETINEEVNIQPYIRTQLWNLAGLLESIAN